MKLIDRDKIIAEIDNRILKYTLLQQKPEMSDLQKELWGTIDCLNSIKGYILNTLEVKEVDLEKEIKHFTMSKELYEADSVIKAVAKHFFELGLKVKQESNNEVKVGETQIYFNDSREQPYVGKGLDLSCMKYETLKTLFKDGDNVEILIRKA